jgi:two-component system NtrC family sensor kinase
MDVEKITKLSWICDLHRLAQSGATLKDSTGIYQQILAHIVNGFGAKSGCLALYIDGQEELTVVAGIDLPDEAIGRPVDMETDVLTWVTQKNTALLLNGACSGNEDFWQQAAAQVQASDLQHSAICWPLRAENKVIGAVCANRSPDMPEFAQADLERGTLILDLASLVLTNIQMQMARQRRIEQLKEANRRLEATQNQLLQSEKMASIGQMAAGVAHEINNPIGFVSSNLGSLEKYLDGVFQLLDAYEKAEAVFTDDALSSVQSLKREIDLSFLKEDIPSLISESREGINRVKTIVQSLKDFSRVDSNDEWQLADLHRGIESTISIVWNQLKYKTEVRKDFGDLPQIECLPSQLNQVYMNMLVNAGQAIRERGIITIRTWKEEDEVAISFGDNGCGIEPENLQRIFDPFFTTKEIGEGTGLGLSISYGIVEKHHGKISVESEVDKGTTFTIRLPIKRADAAADASSVA